jgi:hypothetical protein
LPQSAITDAVLANFATIHAQIAAHPVRVIRGQGRQSKFDPALSMSTFGDLKGLLRFRPDAGQTNPQRVGNVRRLIIA